MREREKEGKREGGRRKRKRRTRKKKERKTETHKQNKTKNKNSKADSPASNSPPLALISTLMKHILAEFGDKAVIYTYITAAPLSPNEQRREPESES